MVDSIVHGNATVLLALLNYARKFPDYPGRDWLPPSLTEANYVPADQSWKLLVNTIVTLILSTLVVIARFWARSVRRGASFGIDDYIAIFAVAFAICFSAVQLVLATGGCVGKHIWDCSFEGVKSAFKYKLIGLLLYVMAAMLIKASICMFTYRLAVVDFKMRVVALATLAVITLSLVISMFQAPFSCNPPTAVYDINVVLFRPYTCINTGLEVYIWAIVYAITDFWVTFMPMPLVWRAQMPLAKKLGITVVLGFGVVASIAASYKVTKVRHAWNTFDPSWNFVPALIWSQLEVNLGLIAASLPALSFLLKLVVPKSMRGYSLSLREILVRARAVFRMSPMQGEKGSSADPVSQAAQPMSVLPEHDADEHVDDEEKEIPVIHDRPPVRSSNWLTTNTTATGGTLIRQNFTDNASSASSVWV